jgi:hypothetical protein
VEQQSEERPLCVSQQEHPDELQQQPGFPGGSVHRFLRFPRILTWRELPANPASEKSLQDGAGVMQPFWLHHLTKSQLHLSPVAPGLCRPAKYSSDPASCSSACTAQDHF